MEFIDLQPNRKLELSVVSIMLAETFLYLETLLKNHQRNCTDSVKKLDENTMRKKSN